MLIRGFTAKFGMLLYDLNMSETIIEPGRIFLTMISSNVSSLLSLMKIKNPFFLIPFRCLQIPNAASEFFLFWNLFWENPNCKPLLFFLFETRLSSISTYSPTAPKRIDRYKSHLVHASLQNPNHSQTIPSETPVHIATLLLGVL